MLDDVARDVVGRVEGALALAAADFLLALFNLRGLGYLDRLVQLGLEFLQIVDRLLEDMAEDLDVDELGIRDGLVLGDRRSRPEVVLGQVAEQPEHLVRDLQVVEDRVVGEEAAVVLADVQVVVADVDRAEHPAEVVPERAGVVRVAVGITPA